MSIESETSALPEGPTGRVIVTVPGGASAEQIREMAGTATLANSETTVLENLGMAVVEVTVAERAALEAAAKDPKSPILAVEPEVYVQALDNVHVAQRLATDFDDRLVGYEDDDVEAAAGYADTDHATWGLYAVRAIAPILFTTPWSGTGTTIAVLDTGIDLNHPDFAGRIVDSQSFIPGEAVQDGHSHGTHCAGTAAGPRVPARGRRYGVASGAGLLVGKVLSNAGGGTSGQVLAGINWAIGKGATVVSMSLGSSVAPGQMPYTYYEEAALRALKSNVVIIAAAGNAGASAPVGSPANCPSVLAVAAVDQNLAVAGFSSRGLNGAGGEINVSAPGVATYSAVPVAMGSYGVKSGTSMATPHAAGIAAIIAQQTGKRGLALWNELMLTCASLSPQPPQDVGYGIAQVPIRRVRLSPVPIPRPISN